MYNICFYLNKLDVLSNGSIASAVICKVWNKANQQDKNIS